MPRGRRKLRLVTSLSEDAEFGTECWAWDGTRKAGKWRPGWFNGLVKRGKKKGFAKIRFPGKKIDKIVPFEWVRPRPSRLVGKRV